MVIKGTVYRKEKSEEGINMIPVITYLECEKFQINGGVLSTNRNESLQMTDYSQYDPISNEFLEYQAGDIYLLNDNGKTMDRIA